MTEFQQSGPNVSIVIVSWNSAKHLPACLECLCQQTYSDFEVIVVDNGSTDGGIDNLEQKWPSLYIQVIKLPTNSGFASANNRGARLARGQWLALLNADAFPEPDWLRNLLKAAESYPDYSCFSSRQIQANAPDILDGTGDAYHVSGLAWKRHLGYPVDQYGLNQEEVFSCCAAAALYLRAAFLEVGGFDEDFFSYFEDTDLGFRLRLYGYKSLYVPEAVVYHVGSASFGLKSDFAFYHVHRNLVWTFVKDMPSIMIWQYLFAHLLANLIYIIYYSIQGRGRVLLKAKWDAVLGLQRMLRKRKIVQGLRKVSNSSLLSVMEHGLFRPYLTNYYLSKSQKER